MVLTALLVLAGCGKDSPRRAASVEPSVTASQPSDGRGPVPSGQPERPSPTEGTDEAASASPDVSTTTPVPDHDTSGGNPPPSRHAANPGAYLYDISGFVSYGPLRQPSDGQEGRVEITNSGTSGQQMVQRSAYERITSGLVFSADSSVVRTASISFATTAWNASFGPDEPVPFMQFAAPEGEHWSYRITSDDGCYRLTVNAAVGADSPQTVGRTSGRGTTVTEQSTVGTLTGQDGCKQIHLETDRQMTLWEDSVLVIQDVRREDVPTGVELG